MTDPIADMLTRIRNAVHARHARVELPASKLKIEIAKILQDEGYIQGFKLIEEPAERPTKSPRQVLRLFLKYGHGGERVISGIERVSRPGRRVYVGREEIPRVRRGLGIAVLSTSKGILSDREAREQKLGGELLCEVW